ncbi:uncharacterized protein LOC134851505 [Symsagittifera roscoffensis]|uniref:uncharacterized protein LOC134851505 n=1 Tax=Symsagittifera roscoffensis TaxID=84072 RepID=UPI00307B4DB8
MEIRWYLLAVIAMQFIVLLFGLLGHGNEIKKSGNTHAGLWKVCVGDSCSEVKKSSFPDSKDWQDTQAARAFLILSHFAGVAVMAQLILATLSMIKATLRVAIHSVTCVIQAFCLGIAVFLMTGLPLGTDMGWSQILAWVAFIFACLILPAGCTQIDEDGKEVTDVNEDK